MKVLGDWNWYFPSFAAKLLFVHDQPEAVPAAD